MENLRRHRWLAGISLAGLLSLAVVTSFHHHEAEAHQETAPCHVCVATSQGAADVSSPIANQEAPCHVTAFSAVPDESVLPQLQQSPYSSRAPPRV